MSSDAPAPEKQAPAPGIDETAVDAPSRQTLFLLGVVCAATLIMWVMGRAACNYHVPGESLTPRALTPVERSRTSKDAAIEFVRALEGGDFETARRLAKGAALASVETVAANCPDCTARLAARSAFRALPVVHQENAKEGYVSIVATGLSSGKKEYLLHVERGPESFQVTEVLVPGAKLPELQSAAEIKLEGSVPAALKRLDEPNSAAP